MKLFRKNKRSLIDQGALSKLGITLDQRQKKLADYLGRRTQYWNRNAKITALAIFSLLFGGAFLLLILHAVLH
ncbi:hypothetical protein SNE26_10240 [Mucilaginibacter sp. cycad4]|uniref:hypothetical protein n=1 Tax=Mucilaginibacter sp. cycad4 TaxID=3342096 RepID=UPI002AAC05DD|nr:hypothetical protein [Mucilaginibacter gossypii]WPV02154.1 hypothetical protein SNE26_10240 [Mucilaginibacter gossypii]